MGNTCSKCKQIDICKDKVDARTIDDDIKYGMVVPNYIPGPNAECQSTLKMTFIEFAENVLGVGLIDWQKVVLEKAQEYKDNGKSFYINDSRAGKTLLVNVIQQKLGYDRGFEDGRKLPHTYENCHNFTCRSHERDNGYEAAVEDLESLLRCRNYPGHASGKGCDGVCSIHSNVCRSCENFGIPYSLLAELQIRSRKNE